MTFQSSSGPLHSLYDFLVGVNRKTGAVENTHLAEAWSVSDDAREWTFHLKENIPYYMSGRASEYVVSPEDVRWTWLLQAGIESDWANNTGTWRPWLESGEDIVVEGNAVTWNLDFVHPDAHIYLSEDWTFGLISKDYWDDVGGEDGYTNHPIGTGAFSFVEYIRNEHFLLERNMGHYRKEPDFRELQFLWIQEPALVLAMTVTGESHISQLPEDLFDRTEEYGLEIAKSTLPGFHLWGVIPWYLPEALDGTPTPNYSENAPTRNKLVRQALNYSIDRNYINDTFFGGDAIPSAVSHMAEWWDSFKDEWAPILGPDGKTGADGGWPYPYDPEKARELLVEAGYPDGFSLDLFASSNLRGTPEIPEVSLAITEMWNEIGINAFLTVTEHSLVQEGLMNRALNGTIFFVRWSPQLPSASMGFLWRKSIRPYYELPFITEWKEHFDTVADPMERKKLIQELGDFWHDEFLSIPLLWVFEKAVYNPGFVEGYEVNQAHFGPVRYHEYTVPIYR